MADHFLSSLQNIKQSFSLSDIDFEFMNNFPGLIPNQQLMGFHQDSFYPGENFEQALITSQTNTSVSHVTDQMVSDYSDSKDRKRKSMDICTPESSSVYSSPQGSENGTTKKNVGGKGKRMKGNGKDAEKPREVVHVRAKRGQATDSHSLAERARRGKINERLRCLQDIVPGCCKTMGMAVMLDEIINYVQSLQNQVEFLSLKLTAASTLQDMNSNTNLIENLQRAKALEALKIQNALGLGNQGISSAQFAQLDLNFGFFPQLPHNL